MAGELHFYREIVAHVDGDKILHVGSRTSPMRAVEVVGVPKIDTTVNVPAGTEVSLWTWSAGNEFAFASFEASGYGELRWKVDKATSSTNRTPLGTFEGWLRKRMSCFAPETFQTDEALCADTAADLVNAAAGGGSVAEGYIYEFRFYNPGTEDVTVKRAIVG